MAGYSIVNNNGTSFNLELQTRVSAGSELSHTSTTRSFKCHNHALSMKYSICNINLLPKAADLRKKAVMNFLYIWRLFFSFFHGMLWLHFLADFQFIPRSQGLSTELHAWNFELTLIPSLYPGETGKLPGRMVTPLLHPGNNGCLL